MLDNMEAIENLRSLSRNRSLSYVTKNISKDEIEAYIEKGWQEVKSGRKPKQRPSSIKIQKTKTFDKVLEDRVWMLLYRMKFDFLSDKKGASLSFVGASKENIRSQIDVVGIDTEVALAIECKSSEKHKEYTSFKKDMTDHLNDRDRFRQAIHKQYSGDNKLHTAMIMFVSNLHINDNDKARAEADNLIIFNENDLEYYEKLVSHLGSAAKYQFLSDIFKGKNISGLEIELPAIKTKMGRYIYYTFSIHPSDLLKISFVSHRAKGKASDIDTYQRMISKSRLRKIQQYIDKGGVFPTNIVINLEKTRKLKFEPAKMEEQTCEKEGGTYGRITLPGCYKSAWIIDGQHRLFAYSGHDRGKKDYISVLAFQDLDAEKQTKFFVDINKEQKSVQTRLLHELFANLNWDAEDEEVRLKAILSRAVQKLDEDIDSPFYSRILKSDASRDAIRCITLTSIFSALEKEKHLFIVKKNIEYGPLWADDQNEVLNRTFYIIKEYFNVIKKKNEEWWQLGSKEGGGLSMNDGVVSLIYVLSRTLRYLQEEKKYRLILLDKNELLEKLQPFADAVADYLSTLNSKERVDFRKLGSEQGRNIRMWQCLEFINRRNAEFNPPDLMKYIEGREKETNKAAREIIFGIDHIMKDRVIALLKDKYNENADSWWYEGVPLPVRKKISDKINEEKGLQGGREDNIEFIQYREILHHSWPVFEKLFSFENSGSKEKRTGWMADINNMRKVVMHAKGQHITTEQLENLQLYEEWLKDI